MSLAAQPLAFDERPDMPTAREVMPSTHSSYGRKRIVHFMQNRIPIIAPGALLASPSFLRCFALSFASFIQRAAPGVRPVLVGLVLCALGFAVPAMSSDKVALTINVSKVGENRADNTFIPGGVIPGYIIIKPDFPECIDDFGFLWFEDEYVIDVASRWVLAANAADAVVNQVQSQRQH